MFKPRNPTKSHEITQNQAILLILIDRESLLWLSKQVLTLPLGLGKATPGRCYSTILILPEKE